MGYYTDHELTAEPNIMDEEFAEWWIDLATD